MNLRAQSNGLVRALNACIDNVEYMMRAENLPGPQQLRLSAMHDLLDEARVTAEDFAAVNTMVIVPEKT